MDFKDDIYWWRCFVIFAYWPHTLYLHLHYLVDAFVQSDLQTYVNKILPQSYKLTSTGAAKLTVHSYYIYTSKLDYWKKVSDAGGVYIY